MEFPRPRDEDDVRVLSLIREHSVFIQNVMGDEEGPSFAYSMGLTHSFEHPEVFISGLSFELHVSMINEICRRLKNGGSHLSHGERVSGLLEGFDCIAANVDPRQGYEYVYYAQWLHRTVNVPLMQLIWPSTSGVWPWDVNAPEDIVEGQLILADVNGLEVL